MTENFSKTFTINFLEYYNLFELHPTLEPFFKKIKIKHPNESFLTTMECRFMNVLFFFFKYKFICQC